MGVSFIKYILIHSKAQMEEELERYCMLSCCSYVLWLALQFAFNCSKWCSQGDDELCFGESVQICYNGWLKGSY